MKPKRTTRKTSLEILRFLAHHGESTEYRVRKKTKMHHSTTQKAIRDLLATDMIQEVGKRIEDEGYGKKYWLTFRGIVELFHYLGSKPAKVKDNEIRKAIIRFNGLDDYPLFLEHKSPKAMFDESIYRIFIETGWLLVEAPPPLLIDPGSPYPLIQTWRSGKQREVKKTWKYLPEDYLKYGFGFVFFTFTGRRTGFKGVSNKALANYMGRMFEKYRNSLSRMAKRVDKIQNEWTNALD